MILFVVSTVLCVYVCVSGVFFAPLPRVYKGVCTLVLLLVSAKYVVYKFAGGSFFAPHMPRALLLGMELLYAALILLFVLLVCKDIYLAAGWLARRAMLVTRWPFAWGAFATLACVLSLGGASYGLWQAVRVPQVRTVELHVPMLPSALDGFTLVQLSDLHIGGLFRQDWLEKVVARTNEAQPQAVVITGDFIDGTPADLAAELAPLAQLRAPLGVYGVTGNHEYYWDAAAWAPVFARLGITMLENEHRVLPYAGSAVTLVGLPDPQAVRFGANPPDIARAVAGAPAGSRIVLAHQPRHARANAAHAQVQLSGHTHGGLFFFLGPIIASYNDGFVRGAYTVGGMRLYVSPGTGLWGGFAARLGGAGEITRVVLRGA